MLFPYKDDNPTERPAVVTVGLIVLNVLVFLYCWLQGEGGFTRSVFELGVIPKELWSGNLPQSRGHFPPASLFTSMFMHAGWLHLIGNMLYLWIFGNNVEDYLGHFRFIVFYVACGLIASFSHILFNLGSTVPMVGASGAIAGVLGAYLVLYPRARVRVLLFLFIFITTFTVPAWLVLGLWFVLQIINSLPEFSGSAGGGVAYLAHVGGFVAGLVYVRHRAGKTRPRRTKSNRGSFR
jgi:membrane associated rhomboid family serine protease